MTQEESITLRRPGRLPRAVTRTVFWVLVGLATGVLVTSLALTVRNIRNAVSSSPTMEPAIGTADHLFVAIGSSGIRRGDIVVLQMPKTATGSGSAFLKRVIGLPGDHVTCCDSRGRVTVNGKPLRENYLYPGNRPSRVTFRVTLGRGQLWVMGDRRNISADSREWGPVPESGVTGRVVVVMHGSSLRAVTTPQAFVSAGLAPADTRLDYYLRLIFLAAACVAALVILAITGITSSMIRGRRSRGAAGAEQGPPPDAAVPAPLEGPWPETPRWPKPPLQPRRDLTPGPVTMPEAQPTALANLPEPDWDSP